MLSYMLDGVIASDHSIECVTHTLVAEVLPCTLAAVLTTMCHQIQDSVICAYKFSVLFAITGQCPAILKTSYAQKATLDHVVLFKTLALDHWNVYDSCGRLHVQHSSRFLETSFEALQETGCIMVHHNCHLLRLHMRLHHHQRSSSTSSSSSSSSSSVHPVRSECESS